MLDFPICLIHPDMVLQNPIKANSEKDILFSYNPDRESFFDDIEKEIIKQIDSRPKFIPFGNVVLFNNINLDFLNNLYHNYVNFSKRDVYKARRYSWIYTLTQNSYGLLKDCFSLGVEEFEQTLLHHNLTNNFIHYQHGLGSDWNKYQFKRPDVLLGTSGPYDSFLSSEIKFGITEPLDPITFPNLILETFIFFLPINFFELVTKFSANNFDLPIIFVGDTTLSVLIKINLETLFLIEA
jgi:hypothetical protein